MSKQLQENSQERPKEGPIYGISPDVVEEIQRRWVAEAEERGTRHAHEHVEQMMERRGPRLRDRVTQAVLGLLAVVLYFHSIPSFLNLDGSYPSF